MMKKEKVKVYIYTRVSTAMQIDGYSLDAQKSRMKAYVRTAGKGKRGYHQNRKNPSAGCDPDQVLSGNQRMAHIPRA